MSAVVAVAVPLPVPPPATPLPAPAMLVSCYIGVVGRFYMEASVGKLGDTPLPSAICMALYPCPFLRSDGPSLPLGV